jgi:two-component system, OmpR family, sensor histidine kinase KdpD
MRASSIHLTLGRGLLGILVAGAATAGAFWLGGRADLTNTAIGYLFIIALVSMSLGYGSAVAAAITSALCFDYFFLPPYGTLNIDNTRDLVTEVSMFGVAIIISSLNERLRKQAHAARRSAGQTESLCTLVNQLAAADSIEGMCITGVREIESAAPVSANILLLREDNSAVQVFSSGGRVAMDAEDLDHANWAAMHREPVGSGTRHRPTASAWYVPLLAARGCIGVLVIRPQSRASGSGLNSSSLIHSMARQMAMAMERALLSEEKRAAEIDAETERVRNAVLSAVSHDLRTPLTVITSASSALVENGGKLGAADRAELSRLINEEAQRLSGLLKSLLDVTRLQAGKLNPRCEWESMEEVVASAVRRVDEQRGGAKWRLRSHVPDDLPLLEIDAVLIEQVLVNLIDNALTHAKSDIPVEITVSVYNENAVLVSVSDHGRGIPNDELARIFDKFYRGGATSSGLGLGLTLARGIVEAHRGKIWATPTAGGGLTIQFTLPTSKQTTHLVMAPPSEGARAWVR